MKRRTEPRVSFHFDRFRNEHVHALGVGWVWHRREFQLIVSFVFGSIRMFVSR